MIAMLERRVCANLRVSPATFLGDYKAVSYSGGQLGVLQEQEMVKEAQAILGQQYYSPVYRDWFNARRMDFVSMFPQVDLAKDIDALFFPEFRLKRYQILDLSKQIKPFLEAWHAGMLTYPEMRQQLGFIGADVDGTIAEWQENRKMLGLPETPESGSMGGSDARAPGEDDDADSDEDGEVEDDDADD